QLLIGFVFLGIGCIVLGIAPAKRGTFITVGERPLSLSLSRSLVCNTDFFPRTLSGYFTSVVVGLSHYSNTDPVHLLKASWKWPTGKKQSESHTAAGCF